MYISKETLIKKLNSKKIQEHINELTKEYEGKKIIAYGAGVMAEYVLDTYDFSKLNIIGFSDSKYYYEKQDFHGFKTFSPNEISDQNPDLILIFVYYDDDIRKFFKVYYPEFNEKKVKSLVKRSFIEKLMNV